MPGGALAVCLLSCLLICFFFCVFLCLRLLSLTGAGAAAEHAGGRERPAVVRAGKYILRLRPRAGGQGLAKVNCVTRSRCVGLFGYMRVA